MDEMTFFSPKSFKKGRLIGGIFRPIDLIILILSSALSLLLVISYLLLGGKSILLLFLFLIPFFTGVFLTASYNIYHNFLIYAILLFYFHFKDKKYIYYGVKY